MPTHSKRLSFLNGCLHPAFLPLALVLCYYLVRSVHMPFSDFAGYYFGGKELLSGRFGNAYDMEQLNRLIGQAGYRDVFVSYAPFPPFTSLIFAPWLVFPPGTAKLLFDSFSCLLFLFTLMRVRVFLSIPPMLVLLVPVVFFVPIANNLYFGQSYLLLSCLLLEGYMAYKEDRIVASSLLWGLAVLFKVFPGVILLFLLLRKQYKAAAGLCIACGALLLLSIGVNGWAAWKYYVFEILPKVNNGELNNSFAFLFQSAFMLLKRLFVYDALMNPAPLTDNPWLFGILLGLFKALIFTVCIGFTLRKKDRDFAAFSVWITGSMLISPNGSSYSLVLLVIPLLALMMPATATLPLASTLPPTATPPPASTLPDKGRAYPILPALILLAACYIPVSRLENAPVLGQFPRLYLLLIFFGLSLRPLRLAWHTGLWAGLSLFFIGLFLIGYHRDTDKSVYFFTREEHIFINDYQVSNGTLVYSYLDGFGPHLVNTGLAVTGWSANQLEVKDKQIFYKGKQLTNSPDVKKKPLLIDGKFILYLSDKNRGPGFYTLRKLITAGQG